MAPLARNPSSHSHVNEPGVLMQLSEQGFVAHSLMSEKQSIIDVIVNTKTLNMTSESKYYYYLFASMTSLYVP